MMIGRPIADLGTLAGASLDVPDQADGAGADPVARVEPVRALREEPSVRIENLHVPADAGATVLEGMDLDLNAGEIVGIAGVEGNGQSELVAALSGARPATGRFTVGGVDLLDQPPAARTAAGVGVIPEDRHLEGCIPAMSVAENLFLGRLGDFTTRGLLRRGAQHRAANDVIAGHGISAAGPDAAMSTLSGGNQQKVVLAKWLSTQPRVLIVDEPTRGIDVATKAEVHRLMSDLAAEGVAIVMVSSELPEVLAVSDRIVVMREGRITAELPLAVARGSDHRPLEVEEHGGDAAVEVGFLGETKLAEDGVGVLLDGPIGDGQLPTDGGVAST
jgi:general nucleoside transport system ATP-binding protein